LGDSSVRFMRIVIFFSEESCFTFTISRLLHPSLNELVLLKMVISGSLNQLRRYFFRNRTNQTSPASFDIKLKLSFTLLYSRNYKTANLCRCWARKQLCMPQNVFFILRECCFTTKPGSASDAKLEYRYYNFVGSSCFLDWPSWFHSTDSSQKLLFVITFCGSITVSADTNSILRQIPRNDLTNLPRSLLLIYCICWD